MGDGDEGMTHGSSPLARGLLCINIRLSAYCGIIPARAGFTTWGRGYGRASRDHPRSRGVYIIIIIII